MKAARFSVLFLLIIVLTSIFGCKKDDTVTAPGGPTPITADLFPAVAGHQYNYVGYAVTVNHTRLPDSPAVYKTKWTLKYALPTPHSTTIGLADTTTIRHPLYGVITVPNTFVAVKDSATGDISFYQTLGPFFRAFHIARTDTVRLIMIAKPSAGVGGTWTALDSTYAGAAGTIRLEILGKVDGAVDVTDSSLTHAVHHTYLMHTYRNIYINGTLTFSNVLTSELWLEPGVGPVQVHIVEDTENLGHFRVLSSISF